MAEEISYIKKMEKGKRLRYRALILDSVVLVQLVFIMFKEKRTSLLPD